MVITITNHSIRQSLRSELLHNSQECNHYVARNQITRSGSSKPCPHGSSQRPEHSFTMCSSFATTCLYNMLVIPVIAARSLDKGFELPLDSSRVSARTYSFFPRVPLTQIPAWPSSLPGFFFTNPAASRHGGQKATRSFWKRHLSSCRPPEERANCGTKTISPSSMRFFTCACLQQRMP